MANYEDSICVNCIWQDQCGESICKSCNYFDDYKNNNLALTDCDLDRIIEKNRREYRRIFWKLYQNEN